MSNEQPSNLFRKEIWLRGLLMLVFALCWGLAEIVLTAVALFQFACVLFTGSRNDNATTLGASLGQYIYQIAQFETFNSEERPYPLAPWPVGNGLIERKR